MTHENRYITAMGHPALTPYYDAFVRVLLRERRLRQGLIDLLDLRSGSRLLDVGSGTGTFAIMAGQQHPGAIIVGVDGDPAIVDIASRKARQARVSVKFQVASATRLPFADASFDRVTSTFVLHHLSAQAKERALVEAFRVLRIGGAVHIVDFGPPRSPTGRALSRLIRGMGEIADNLDGLLPAMLMAAGFTNVREEHRMLTPFGPAIFLSGVRAD